MVRYGGGGLSSGGRNRPFRYFRLPRLNLRNGLLLLIALFVMRNLLRNDYLEEEIQHLRKSGMTDQQIKRYVPETALGQAGNEELKKMKEEIANLKKEFEELKAGQLSSEKQNHDSGRGEPLISVDQMHQEKRKRREEQLLRDHPNFKPSKRLKDSLVEKE